MLDQIIAESGLVYQITGGFEHFHMTIGKLHIQRGLFTVPQLHPGVTAIIIIGVTQSMVIGFRKVDDLAGTVKLIGSE